MNTETSNPFLKTKSVKSEPVKNRWSQLEFEPEEEERSNRFSNNREFSDNSFNRDGDRDRDRGRDRNPTFLRFAAVKHKKAKPPPIFDLSATKDDFPSL
jgi:hypothetical protein|tara:strand:+ start:699 stop:995 length:297 start_codon:yes stop_codon:yes gene_type:complete